MAPVCSPVSGASWPSRRARVVWGSLPCLSSWHTGLLRVGTGLVYSTQMSRDLRFQPNLELLSPRAGLLVKLSSNRNHLPGCPSCHIHYPLSTIRFVAVFKCTILISARMHAVSDDGRSVIPLVHNGVSHMSFGWLIDLISKKWSGSVVEWRADEVRAGLDSVGGFMWTLRVD